LEQIEEILRERAASIKARSIPGVPRLVIVGAANAAVVEPREGKEAGATEGHLNWQDDGADRRDDVAWLPCERASSTA
jgi:hypothetical protein